MVYFEELMESTVYPRLSWNQVYFVSMLQANQLAPCIVIPNLGGNPEGPSLSLT